MGSAGGLNTCFQHKIENISLLDQGKPDLGKLLVLGRVALRLVGAAQLAALCQGFEMLPEGLELGRGHAHAQELFVLELSQPCAINAGCLGWDGGEIITCWQAR